MSKFAMSFLVLTLACAAVVLTGSGVWLAVAKAGAAIFGLFFFASLLVGRRIKFDPVLR